MSRRVAIRKAPPLAAAAIAAAPVAGMVAGKAAKEAAKEAAKQSFVDKVKDSAAQQAGKQLANAPKEMAQRSQDKIAEQNKQSQQNMQQQGQQMAEKAKAGSQIATGEAMDMSWQMLKAWSFTPGFDEFDKQSIIEHANKMKLKHVSIHDLGHHDKRFHQRYKPDQEMPKGAENLTPRDLSLAYMDLMLRRNAELIERGNQKTKVGGRDEYGNPHPDNFPGISFPLLQTDEPIRSQVKEDKGRIIDEYHPVFAAGHPRHEPSEHPKFALVTANDLPTQAGNRKTIKATHTVNLYSHDHYPIVDDEASQAFYEGMYEQEEKQKKDEYDFEEKEESPRLRNRRIVTDEINRRHFGDFLQPLDFERMKEEGFSPSLSQRVAEERVYGHNPMAEDSFNPLKIYPDSSNPLARQYSKFQAKNRSGGDESGGRKLQPIATQPPLHLGNGMYIWQGNYYGGIAYPPLPPEAAEMIQNGEPMDMAWRMLKSQLLTR